MLKLTMDKIDNGDLLRKAAAAAAAAGAVTYEKPSHAVPRGGGPEGFANLPLLVRLWLCLYCVQPPLRSLPTCKPLGPCS